MSHRQRPWQRCRDFSTPAGSTAYHYFASRTRKCIAELAPGRSLIIRLGCLPKADSSECLDFSTRSRSTTYHYFFLCLDSQSWCWPAPLSQRRLWRRCFAEAPRRRLAEVALAGAAIAEAPVAPGASPTQTKASLHTKEVKDIAGASLSARRGGRLPSRVASSASADRERNNDMSLTYSEWKIFGIPTSQPLADSQLYLGLLNDLNLHLELLGGH